MALQEAIDAYHSLLNEDLAADSMQYLETQMHNRGLYFGERMLSSVLRPRFVTPEQYRYLQERVKPLLTALDKVYQRAIADDAFRAQFGMYDWEEDLIRIEPGFRDASPVSRLDAFFVHERGGLRFTEYNAETPAAASYNDVLAEVFIGLPVMREFLRTYEVRPQQSRHNVLHALLDSYHQFSGTRAAPVIAIVDWPEVPTYSEFVITKQYFETQGLRCIIADPRELDYRSGRLYADDLAIDLVYKRVLIGELVERCGLDHALIRAVRDRAVCMVNPFRCKILHKKMSLAVLNDDRNSEMFTAAESEAIEAHIPWTRGVQERRTKYHGREIDLVPFVAENRDRLVLKPNDEYGGKGIVLGWEVDDSEWERALNDALKEPFIVQERITLPTEMYPVIVNGRVQMEDRILDTAPFVFYGSYMDGLLTRLSTESLVNVTAGGGSSVATFLVARR